MIDFHTHILPNVDDGARSVEETFNLIKEAKEAGFQGIISTSHYYEGYYEIERREREVLMNAISDNLKNSNLDIDLYLGNEIYISENMINLLKEEKACTINDTSYVLFEMPFNIKPINLYDVIYDMLEYKLVPILAHPERYSFIQNDLSLVHELIKTGVLMQSNYGSIIGEYGKKAKIILKKLLENNMVHFLGTDVHKENTIYPKMPQILKEIENLIGKEKLEVISKINPRLVLENKRIEILEPTEPSEIKITFTERIQMGLI